MPERVSIYIDVDLVKCIMVLFSILDAVCKLKHLPRVGNGVVRNFLVRLFVKSLS